MSGIPGFRPMTLWSLLQKYDVDIPIIQRDYAQGRPETEEIRTNFVEALFHAFKDEPVELDFVYGSIVASRFQPLDGQQRLTTIYLLHWYLCKKESKLNDENRALLRKFGYETRASSREFCQALINADITIPADGDLKKRIEDAAWFHYAWRYDPTIQGMLVMLDAIHKRFREYELSFDRLRDPDNCPISFLLLPLDGIGLSDDLYIKMNARGKPLTTFENFKAKLEQHIRDDGFCTKRFSLTTAGKERIVSVHDYFSFRIDTAWAKLFWAISGKEPKNYDPCFFRFIEVFLFNRSASKNGGDFLKDLFGKGKAVLSFRFYVEKGCVDEKFIVDLIAFLDLLSNSPEGPCHFLPDFRPYDEGIAIAKAAQGYADAAYTERIHLHAYQQYLVRWSDGDVFSDHDGLERWMRLVHNLISGTAPYNNETEFANSIQAVDHLLEYGADLYPCIQSLDGLPGMDKLQFREEQIKAALLFREDCWAGMIFPMEQIDYFDGQIGFLLFLSGIDAYFERNGDCAWSAEEDKAFRDSFAEYSAKARALFDDEGIRDFGEFRWERALLAIDDYLTTVGSNQSFGAKNGRDIGWRRFLKGDRETTHRPTLKRLIDQVDPADPKSSLQAVIDNSKATGWRRLFLENPELLSYLSRSAMNVRKESTQGFVLLKGERMSGAHAELHTYNLFKRQMLNAIDITPFSRIEYYDPPGDASNEPPCLYLDGFERAMSHYVLDVAYDYDLGKFRLDFFHRGDSGNFAGLDSILEGCRFMRHEERYSLHAGEGDVVQTIAATCSVLRGTTSASDPH